MPCSKKTNPTDEMITLLARAAAPHVTWQLKKRHSTAFVLTTGCSIGWQPAHPTWNGSTKSFLLNKQLTQSSARWCHNDSSKQLPSLWRWQSMTKTGVISGFGIDRICFFTTCDGHGHGLARMACKLQMYVATVAQRSGSAKEICMLEHPIIILHWPNYAGLTGHGHLPAWLHTYNIMRNALSLVWKYYFNQT